MSKGREIDLLVKNNCHSLCFLADKMFVPNKSQDKNFVTQAEKMRWAERNFLIFLIIKANIGFRFKIYLSNPEVERKTSLSYSVTIRLSINLENNTNEFKRST